MKYKWSTGALVFLFILSVFFNGLDLTHHTHNSWLYNQMIRNWDYYSTDPYLGEQITYAYGVPAYIVGGLLWFISATEHMLRAPVARAEKIWTMLSLKASPMGSFLK